MKIYRMIVFILFLAACLSTSPAATKTGRGGWSADSPYCRLYEPGKSETLKGEITAIGTFTPRKGMSHGVHLTLKTGKEEIHVHLGPSWYLDNQEMELKIGDKVEVTGSRVTFDGKPAVIASRVVRGDQMLQLRDSNGVPLWSGWRRR